MLFNTKINTFKMSGLQVTHLNDEISLRSVGVNSKLNLLESVTFEKDISFSSFIAGEVSSVFIGAYSYMNGDGYLRNNTIIGRFCSIGRRVTINAGMHNISGVSSHPKLQNGLGRPYADTELSQCGIKSSSRNESVFVGHDVWIGDGAIIMPGVSIGVGAVVASNAVVVSDVPAYSIVGGVPAKIIRYRFSTEIISRFLSSNYWEFDIEFINKFSLSNVVDFLDEFDRFKSDQDFYPYETFMVSSM